MWNKIMSQMNKKKNHNTDQKMSANETSATIMAASLGLVEPSGTTVAAAQVIPLGRGQGQVPRTAEHRVLPANHPQRVMRTAARGASLTVMVVALLALLGPVILPFAVPAPPPSKAMP
jgi:hypothetical protein